jgi:hypothetical protein
MKLRPGVYVIPTHHWSITRTVWLIAGIVLLVGTTLAALVRPWSIFLVVVTGLTSIAVSLTGFCVVGNILRLCGVTAMLGRLDATPSDSVLSLVHGPWWSAFTGFVGVAMVWFAATGYCIMANGLYWLGAEPRLAPLDGTGRPIPHTDRPKCAILTPRSNVPAA